MPVADSLQPLWLESEALPVPTIVIDPELLVAGTVATVRLRLPATAAHLTLKFWVNDLQTRSLLNGPHWLDTWVPTDQGLLETQMPVSIPPEALEIQLVAITVEPTTQRESHWTTLDCWVTHPEPLFDLPLLGDGDEFEVLL
ncbi:hypothetical protein DO97_02565 [Neosynechococcus sphagnicola sy1]|uniref:Uncharacterized protein n=1 Tax=Neosynechococcus sphagnicola sy1 TaxID=1497020 RepID=A0A098TKX0_9CYAN|nr:hypothetical protein DO97_02565 [Neosynechococcus sphagnicola sy1]